MRIYTSFKLSICLMILLLGLSTSVVFSQSDEGENTEAATMAGEESPGYVKGITSARARSLVGGVFGLVSVIIGWRVKSSNSAGRNTSRGWTIAGLALGSIAVVWSINHLAGNTGSFGTGGGKAGAIVAFALGIIGAGLSALSLMRRKG